jgi:hypothetical protein
MSSERKAKPFLLSITLYSLMVAQVFALVGWFGVALRMTDFKQLYLNFSLDPSTGDLFSTLYYPVIFILFLSYSTIQMLRRKTHAFYMFLVLSLILVIALASQSPPDITNIFLTAVVNAVLALHLNWFFRK